ncbi:uncharacterized protein TrAtP1_011175 [Trichoderma atroviride]|uniref:uncharacterized protein n=1 Tax=Hypocrea atroviridis TaxID=63577 RepID=UPI003320C753|nr:hypothetical protein TrAtP1_011175 [Trichoderma atroviride]
MQFAGRTTSSTTSSYSSTPQIMVHVDSTKQKRTQYIKERSSCLYLSLFWHVIFVIRLIVQQIHKYTNTSPLDRPDEEQTRDYKRKINRTRKARGSRVLVLQDVLGGASALLVPASGTDLLIGREKGVWLMHGGISRR